MSIDLLQMAKLTLTQPRQGLRALLNLGLPQGVLIAGLVLTAVLSALFLHLSIQVSPVPEGNAAFGQLFGSPFVTAITQAAVLFLTAALIYRIGRAFGGYGRFDEALLAMVWLQTILVVLQGAQFLSLILLPPLASLIGLISVVLFLWLLCQFIAELHGFTSILKVFVAVVASFFAVVFVLSLILVSVFGPGAFTSV